MGMNLGERVYGAVLGHILGDIIGIPYEGSRRRNVDVNAIMKFRCLKYRGECVWSDDTALTLATIDALVSYGYSLEAIANNFIQWYVNGKYSSHGRPFGIGRTVRRALNNLLKGKPPTSSGLKDEFSNGNGSLMRIMPVPLYFHCRDLKTVIEKVHEVSAITHAHPRSLVGCGLYSIMVYYIIRGYDKHKAYDRMVEEANRIYGSWEPFSSEMYKYYSRIIKKELPYLSRKEIKSTGYVVYTLEAILWLFLNSRNYVETIVNAISLGHDTDTIAAIAGSLAGLYHGIRGIPKEWITCIPRLEWIMELINKYIEAIKRQCSL